MPCTAWGRHGTETRGSCGGVAALGCSGIAAQGCSGRAHLEQRPLALVTAAECTQLARPHALGVDDGTDGLVDTLEQPAVLLDLLLRAERVFRPVLVQALVRGGRWVSGERCVVSER